MFILEYSVLFVCLFFRSYSLAFLHERRVVRIASCWWLRVSLLYSVTALCQQKFWFEMIESTLISLAFSGDNMPTLLFLCFETYFLCLLHFISHNFFSRLWDMPIVRRCLITTVMHCYQTKQGFARVCFCFAWSERRHCFSPLERDTASSHIQNKKGKRRAQTDTMATSSDQKWAWTKIAFIYHFLHA